VAFYAEVGSIQNLARVADVLARHRPAILYHAAAYKHVPIMEEHAFEAVENNIFGTHTVTCLAAEYNVADFVTISSDKAVRPTSVMGATSGLGASDVCDAELGDALMAVRFGNVLESNGSVVPIFKQQIEEGGPVTITHPEMSRYFMTISRRPNWFYRPVHGERRRDFRARHGRAGQDPGSGQKPDRAIGLQPDVDIKIEFTTSGRVKSCTKSSAAWTRT